VVRLVEKHVPGGGIYWNGPHVAEIYSIGMVYGGLRLSVAVRRHTEAFSNFPSALPEVSFITVDSPASRKHPVAIDEVPAGTCLHPG
jgi:hypothetical protein